MVRHHLQSLDLIVINEGLEFHDDGFVESVEGHRKMLCREYGVRYKPSSIDAKGRIFRHNSIYHIYYLHSEDPIEETIRRSHEETHFLDFSDNLFLLQEAYKENLGLGINFDTIGLFYFNKQKRKEVKAFLGSIYALRMNGYSDEVIGGHARKRYEDGKKHFLTAFRIYQKAKRRAGNTIS